MLSQEEKYRYDKHLLLSKVGEAGQEKLKSSKVLVIGAGGLGCPVLQYLTAAGVGTIAIMDHDIVSVSNLQRQVLYGESSIGKLKVEEAYKNLSDLNPFVTFELIPNQITSHNAIEIVSKYDVVVDCTDNYPTRYLINDACVHNQTPLVYGAIHKFEGQVALFDNQNSATYRCVYPTPPTAENTGNCSEIGVIGVLPGVIGTMQASEVIKHLLGLGESLNNKLFVFNVLNNSASTFNIQRKKHQVYSQHKQSNKLASEEYELNCRVDLNSIKSNYDQIVDVRNPREEPKINATHQIPLNELEQRYNEIDRNKSTLVVCQSGIRSAKAIQWLEENKMYNNLQNLEGGLKE